MKDQVRHWWDLHQAEYDTLYPLVILLLNLSGSTAEVERTFSTLHAVDDPMATNMSAQTVEERVACFFHKDILLSAYFPDRMSKRLDRPKPKRPREEGDVDEE